LSLTYERFIFFFFISGFLILMFLFFSGCAIGDLVGPVIVAVCADKVLHVNLNL